MFKAPSNCSIVFFSFQIHEHGYFYLLAMYDLRLCLFFSYIAYGFFLPSVFIFLLFIYKNLSHFLIPVIIIDTVLFLILLATLYLFRAEKQRFWLYIIFIITIILITVRNLYLFISIIYRTMTEFEKKKAIFTDAIDRQIDLLQEPQHPVWKTLLLKQCCGLNSKSFKPKSAEYQWLQQTPFLYFCPGSHLKEDQISKFEQTFKMQYSPQGPCLPLVNNELKIELILISVGLGLSVLLMLLAWLFIWQNRLTYLNLLRNMLQEQKKNSIISTNKSSIASIIQQSVISATPETPIVDKSNQLVTTKSSGTKRLYQGYLTALEDVK